MYSCWTATTGIQHVAIAYTGNNFQVRTELLWRGGEMIIQEILVQLSNMSRRRGVYTYSQGIDCNDE